MNRRSRFRDEEGISIVEMLVAIVLLGLIMGGMARSLVVTMMSAQGQERQVRATSLARELMEEARGVSWEQLGLCQDDIDAEFSSGTYTFPDGDKVVVPLSMSSSICSPIEDAPLRPVRVITRDDVDYEVRVVVGWHDDPIDGVAPSDTEPDDLKHLLVAVSWGHQGQDLSTQMESFVGEDAFTPVLTPTVLQEDASGNPASVTYLNRYDGVDEAPNENDGLTQTDVLLTVTTSTPQSAVTARWLKADGTYISPVAMLKVDALTWEHLIPNGSPDFESNRLANGETIFEFTGTDEATSATSVAYARGLFLIERIGVGVSAVGVLEPDGSGPTTTLRADAAGTLCGPYTLTVFADGLLRSDFVRAVWTHDLGTSEMQNSGSGSADARGAGFTASLSGSVPLVSDAAEEDGTRPVDQVTVSFYLERVGDGHTVGSDPLADPPPTPPWTPSQSFTVEEVASCGP